MKRFIMVDWDMLKYGFSPLEVLLYAFIRPYSDKGIGYETKYAELAKFFSVTERQIKYAVKQLKSGGYLNVKRRQYDVVLTAIQKDKNDISDFQKDKNDMSEAVQKDNLTISERQNRQVSHITSNNKSNREDIYINNIPPVQKDKNDISESDTKQQPEETKEPETVTAETEPVSTIEQRRRNIVLTGIIEQYEKRGNIYIPNYVTQTTVVGSLIGKVCMMMQHYGIEDTDDNFADVWRRFLQAGYDAGDDFQREHWTLDYIDKQFQTIFNRLKNGTTKNAGSTRKGERRVSDDYLRGLMQKAGLNL